MTISLCAVISAQENDIPTGSWNISASSDIGNTIGKAFDGDPATYWHSFYTAEDGKVTGHDECPHVITVDFGMNMDVSGWRYTARTDNNNGIVQSYNVYASQDGMSFKKIYEGTFDFDMKSDYKAMPTRSASWGNVTMRAIKIEILTSIAGYGTGAEIVFLTGGSGTSITDGEEYTDKKNAEPEGASRLTADASWQFTASSDLGDSVWKAFDSDTSTFWHTNYTAEGSTITNHDECPHVITVDFGKTMKISGWKYTARTSGNTGIFQGYNIYASKDGTSFEKIYTDTFDFDTGAGYKTNPSRTAFWGDTEMRAIRIEVTSSIGGYGVAAEIAFYTGGNVTAEKPAGANDEGTSDAATDDGKLSRKGWKVTVNSDLGGTINATIDNNPGTNWHSKYTAEGPNITGHDEPPFYLDFTLPELTEISGVSLLPRNPGNTGMILGFNIYASDKDEGDWFCLKDNLNYEESYAAKDIFFAANVAVKRIRLEVISSIGGYGTLAEFYAYAAKEENPTVSFEEFKKAEEENMLYELDSAYFTATCESETWANNGPKFIFDGSTKTFWQTTSLALSGGTTELTVDMNAVHEISEIHYTPRQQDDDGMWYTINIWAAEKENDWKPVKENYTLDHEFATKSIVFDTPVRARWFSFEILEHCDAYASCAELSFYQNKAAKDAEEAENGNSFVLKIGSNEIAYTKAGESGTQTIDVAPYIVAGSTLIPLRGLLELMGAKIDWDGVKQKITVDDSVRKIVLQIGNKLVYVDDPRYGAIRYTLLNFPVIKDSRTFIPVRFVSEQLGYKVDWNGETQTITITK